MPRSPVQKLKRSVFLKHPLCFAIVGCLLWAPWAQAQPADVANKPGAAELAMQQRISRFMAGLEQLQPAWLQHPELMALHWVGLPAPAQRSLHTTCSPVENPQSCTVTVKQGGLLDDAIAGSKTTFTFQALATGWQLTHVTEAWRCQRALSISEKAEQYQLKPCP